MQKKYLESGKGDFSYEKHLQLFIFTNQHSWEDLQGKWFLFLFSICRRNHENRAISTEKLFRVSQYNHLATLTRFLMSEINGQQLSPNPITCSVPQSSSLGLILLLLYYCNGFENCLKCF